MKKSIISKFIEVMLKIIYIVGIICLFFIPKLYNLLSDIGVPAYESHTLYYKLAFYCCYIICLCIIFMLNIIFKNIYNDSPFKIIIEKSLKIIAVLFILLSIIVAVKVIYIPTVLSIGVVLVTFLMGLCFYVLSQIIKTAIYYKNEVDFTV